MIVLGDAIVSLANNQSIQEPRRGNMIIESNTTGKSEDIKEATIIVPPFQGLFISAISFYNPAIPSGLCDTNWIDLKFHLVGTRFVSLSVIVANNLPIDEPRRGNMIIESNTTGQSKPRRGDTIITPKTL